MATVAEEPRDDQPESGDGRQFLDLFAALAAPFHPSEVRERSQGNRTFQYITARVVMNRLDDVLGPAGWWDEYVPGEKSVICRLSICLPDGHVLTKSDAGGYAGMADAGDDDKSGYSDGFKRAAVKFGIGRALYRDGVPSFVTDRYPNADVPVEGGQAPQARRESMPSQGRPPSAPQQDNGRQYQGGDQRKPYDGPNKPPRSGRALFAWTKDQEQKHEVGLLKYINGWAKLQDFPARMVDWDEEQVSLAYAEAVRKLQAIPPVEARGDAYEDTPAN